MRTIKVELTQSELLRLMTYGFAIENSKGMGKQYWDRHEVLMGKLETAYQELKHEQLPIEREMAKRLENGRKNVPR